MDKEKLIRRLEHEIEATATGKTRELLTDINIFLQTNDECPEVINEIGKTLKHADSEGTRAPYWAIVDTVQNMSCDIHIAASQITGIFFSRKDAENYLNAKRYNYSKRAKVYCFSGHASAKYEHFWAKLNHDQRDKKKDTK